MSGWSPTGNRRLVWSRDAGSWPVRQRWRTSLNTHHDHENDGDEYSEHPEGARGAPLRRRVGAREGRRVGQPGSRYADRCAGTLAQIERCTALAEAPARTALGQIEPHARRDLEAFAKP